MSKKVVFFSFVLIYILSFLLPAAGQNLASVNGVIEEIDGAEKLFIIVTDKGQEKVILTGTKTSFTLNLDSADFEDFKVGDKIVISTSDPLSNYELRAAGVFDNDSACMLILGQESFKEYHGEILEINEDFLSATTDDGIKVFKIIEKTDNPQYKKPTEIKKDLREVSITEFSPGDEFYGRGRFPGFLSDEPKTVELVYLKDPSSFVNDLIESRYGSFLLRGKVTDTNEKNSLFKIGDEKILVNKSTIMFVTSDFDGLNSLKGKSVIVYGMVKPEKGKDYFAGALMAEDSIPVVIETLLRIDTTMTDKAIVGEGKITRIVKDSLYSSIYIEEADTGKEILLQGNFRVIDEREPERENLSADFLKVGDTIQAEGYDRNRVKTIYLKKKTQTGSSRYEELNIFFFTDLCGYLNPIKTGGTEALRFLTEESDSTSSSISVQAGGFEYLSSAYKNLSSKTRNNLFLCNGNFLYGTPLADGTDGEAVISCFNKAGISASTLGPLDFMTGKEKLLKLIEKASFPILGANVVIQGTNEPLPGIEPYTIIDYKGVKVGIMGLVDSELSSLVPGEYLKDITVNDYKFALQKYYPALEAEADIIIILSNQDFYDNYLLAQNFENILPGSNKKPVQIIGGAIKSEQQLTNASGILITSQGTEGKYLGHISLGVIKGVSPSYKYRIHLVSPGLTKEVDRGIENPY